MTINKQQIDAAVKVVKGIGGGATAVVGTVVSVVTVADKVLPAASELMKEYRDSRREALERQVEVPDVLRGELDEAKNAIRNAGLTPLCTALKANRKYKDYDANIVIKTAPKPNKRVDKTATVKLSYLTQKMIDKSNQMAIDFEEKKLQQSQERREKIYDMLHKPRAGFKKKKEI